jgi:hypothetical protein
MKSLALGCNSGFDGICSVNSADADCDSAMAADTYAEEIGVAKNSTSMGASATTTN